MPRTTLNIDTTVLRALKRRQRRDKRPLGAIASELLATALASEQGEDRLTPLEWIAAPLRPKVDLEDKEAVQRILDQR